MGAKVCRLCFVNLSNGWISVTWERIQVFGPDTNMVCRYCIDYICCRFTACGAINSSVMQCKLNYGFHFIHNMGIIGFLSHFLGVVFPSFSYVWSIPESMNLCCVELSINWFIMINLAQLASFNSYICLEPFTIIFPFLWSRSLAI